MRKIYKMAGLACLGLLLSTQNSNAQTESDFENLTLSPNSFWDGSDMSGVHNNGEFYSEFTSGDFTFPNVFDTTWGAPGYWLGGFAYSNMIDSITSGIGNKYSSRAGGGSGNSLNYGVSQNNSSITVDGLSVGGNDFSINISNTTYAYNSMRDGDAFAKKFGGLSGNDPDWFKLDILTFSNGTPSDTFEIYLADFRFTDNSQDYILKDWTSFNGEVLNVIDSLYFQLSSSDTGTFGMNTPAFFCLDGINFSIFDNVNEFSQNNFSYYPNPASSFLNISATKIIESVHIMDINGREVIHTTNNKSNQLKINVEELKSGVYFIQLISNGTSQIQKFIKQ